MKRISCIFGRHWYKPSEIELYLAEKKPHSNVYRAIAKCMYCGKENEQLIEIPHFDADMRGDFENEQT